MGTKHANASRGVPRAELRLSRSPMKPRQPPMPLSRISPSKTELRAAGVGEENSNAEREKAERVTRGITAQAINSSTLLSAAAANHAREEDEPELPPTPTQLGLEALLQRPKGRLSSSNLSSSPSRRTEKRNDREAGVALTSSPLKPRDPRPAPLAQLVIQNHSYIRLENREEENLQPKRKLKNELAAQLERLQKEVSRLEEEVARPGKRNGATADAKAEGELLYALLNDCDEPNQLTNSCRSLLTTSNPSCETPALPLPQVPTCAMLSSFLPFASHWAARPSNVERSPSLPPDHPLDPGADPLSYLTLFAPLTLSTHTTTTTSAFSALEHVHTVTFSAPLPFPPHAFSVALNLTTDPESQTIVALELVSLGADDSHKELRTWIHSRLITPLHKLDISGLCWGIGRYWQACVRRARLWAMLDRDIGPLLKPHQVQTIGDSTDKPPQVHGDSEQDLDRPVTNAEISMLLPHLTRSSTLISLPTPLRKRQPKILATWDLVFDWAGDVDGKIDVSAVGVGRKGEDAVKGVFGGLLEKAGFLKAMQGILGIIFGDESVRYGMT